MAIVKTDGSRVVIEGDIPKTDQNWIIEIGTIIYAPDSRGYIRIAVPEPWEGTERQLDMFVHNLIYPTKELAEARRWYERMVLEFLDRADAI